MGRTVAEALNLSVSLSASRVLSPLFIFLHQSVWFCLSVCPPLLRGSTFSLTWYFYLFFIVVFIHHSISFASFIYLCICTYLRPFIHQSSCLSFVSVYFTFHIFHLAKIYIYIYLFIYPLKRTMCLAISPRVSLSLSLFVSRCWNIQRFVEIRPKRNAAGTFLYLAPWAKCHMKSIAWRGITDSWNASTAKFPPVRVTQQKVTKRTDGARRPARLAHRTCETQAHENTRKEGSLNPHRMQENKGSVLVVTASRAG